MRKNGRASEGHTMCGRARCTLRPEDLPAACGFHGSFKTIDAERYRPSYNMSPGSYMPVVRYNHVESTEAPVVHCMKWGLVPSFTKKSEQPDYFRMFNARSESVQEKASFRRLLPKCRCLVAVEGFYEWKKDGAKKQPYYIHFKDERPLVFAALFDCWTDAQGEVLYTFTILTTRSSKALEWLHDRMPVILGTKEAKDSWLNTDISELSLQKVTGPYEAPDLVWYPVTPAMGKASFDGPECIKQIKTEVDRQTSLSQLFSKQKTSIQPRYKTDPEKQEPAQEEDLKLPSGSLMDEQEMKAFVAAMEPDKDISAKAGHPDESDENKDLDVKESKSSQSESKTATGSAINLGRKALKRKQPEDISPSAKKQATAGEDKQKTLRNFFGKQ